MTANDKLRTRTLRIGAAYAALFFIVVLDWLIAGVHFGALAIIPILLLAYYAGSRAALMTAIPSAAILAALDHDVFTSGHMIRMNVEVDAVILAASLYTAITVTKRLQVLSAHNALLAADLEDVRKISQRDPLTGLPNRSAFSARIAQALTVGEVTHAPFAVLFADLDGFKEINDVEGHDAGDRLLRLAATRLRYALRSADMVSRIGGDEFAALLEGVTRGEGQTIAAKIERAFQEPFFDNGVQRELGITVGVSEFPTDATAADPLVRAADEAMYERKRAKKLAARPA